MLAELARRRSARWIVDDRRAVEERVAGISDEAALVARAATSSRRLARRRRERLLDEDVLAGLERRRGRARSASRPASRSRPRRSSVVGEDVVEVASSPRRPGSGARSCSSALRSQVADRDDLGVRRARRGCGRGSGPSSRARRRRRGRGRAHRGRLPLPEELRTGVRQEQPEVEAERPAARVGDVHLERLAERRVRARRHLPEAGDARRARGSARSGAARSARSRTGCTAAGRRATCRRAAR